MLLKINAIYYKTHIVQCPVCLVHILYRKHQITHEGKCWRSHGLGAGRRLFRRSNQFRVVLGLLRGEFAAGFLVDVIFDIMWQDFLLSTKAIHFKCYREVAINVVNLHDVGEGHTILYSFCRCGYGRRERRRYHLLTTFN